MRSNFVSESGLSIPRLLFAVTLGAAAVLMAAFSGGTAAKIRTGTGNSNGSWTLIHSPNHTSQGLESISCVSTTDCWAVGRYTKTDVDEYHSTLIEHWNGVAWTIVPSPNGNYDNFYQDNWLHDVTCVSSSDCWAVGDFDSPSAPTLIEHWDGTAWSITPSPHTESPVYHYLWEVACTSASSCWAIGSAYDEVNYTVAPLVERWNGSSWSTVNSPAGVLKSITCSRTTGECWALGDNFIHWDGNSWTVLSPAPSDQWGALKSLACTSSTDCWASDDYTGMNHWNGTAWSFVRYGGEHVTCNSATDCWAVASSSADESSREQPLVQHWNGTQWSVVTSPTLENESDNVLHDISCPSASACFAVGDSRSGSYRPSHTLAEQWNGASWTLAKSQDAAGGGIDGYLTDIACASMDDCWAVGSLIAHWKDNSWAITPSPIEGPALVSVACTSVTDCWAVGERYIDYNLTHTLIEHWDGTAWTIVSSPNGDENLKNSLHDIACASASDCWTVGRTSDYEGKIPAFPVAEHWDGNSWSLVPLPADPADPSYNSITCSSSADCWMVGSQWNGSADQTVILHWSGSAWAPVSSPNRESDYDSWLRGVVCVSAADCWAVGNLIAHWNGTSWMTVPVAGADQVFSLSDVSCTSSTNCWAIGSHKAMHWDGNSWTDGELESATYPWYYESSFAAVACLSESRCWAVGDAYHYYADYGIVDERTLIDQFTPKPPLVNVASQLAHNAGGTFDVDLTTEGTPTVECRRGGPNNDYNVVFTFADAITSVDELYASTPGDPWAIEVPHTGNIGVDPHQYIVGLSSVPNASRVNIVMVHVRDAAGNVANFSQEIDFLLGDTNGDGSVNSADVGQTKSQSGASLTNSNFREDLNADGSINSADVSLVKSRSGTALPSNNQPVRMP